jgi:hypothetical protein
MAWGSRVLVCCVVTAWTACAGDNRLDPSELELRDVLGMSPDMALAWDADQRAAARRVIDEGMHAAQTAPIRVPLAHEATADHSVVTTLATADNARAKEHQGAVGVVSLAIDRELTATAHPSTIAPRGAQPIDERGLLLPNRGTQPIDEPGLPREAALPNGSAELIEIELAGWDHPGWESLPGRGLDVLAAIASDAGHRTGPVVVTPAPQLAVIAAYIPGVPGVPARLLINPVLLAALEPTPSSPTLPIAKLPLIAAIDTTGNPYSFYGSIAECANAQRTRCEACLPNNSCTAVSGSGDGNAQCAAFADDEGRGYSLECINLAIAIDSVATCTLAAAPTCPFDGKTTNLDKNADFLDRPECAAPLDTCLGKTFGPAAQSTPHGSTTSCSDSSCDAEPSCDDSCGDDSGGDSCDSGDSGDSCDSDGCSGGNSGGDCSGGGDDCSGGGDSCAGDSGGDCGGGDDCNASGVGRRRHDDEYLWALLPLPFAVIARRRADRRRAKKAVTA